MESNMKVSNRVLTMGPLMVAVNDLLVDASSSRLADEGKLSRHFCSLSQSVNPFGKGDQLIDNFKNEKNRILM